MIQNIFAIFPNTIQFNLFMMTSTNNKIFLNIYLLIKIIEFVRKKHNNLAFIGIMTSVILTRKSDFQTTNIQK